MGDGSCVCSRKAPGPDSAGFLGIIDPDTWPGEDSVWRLALEKSEAAWTKQVMSVPGFVQSERLGNLARTGQKFGPTVATSPLNYERAPTQDFGCSDQHRRGLTLSFTDDVQHLVDAVTEINVGSPRWAEHDRVAPGFSTVRMARRIVITPVGFRLGDPEKDASQFEAHADEPLCKGLNRQIVPVNRAGSDVPRGFLRHRPIVCGRGGGGKA